jgi:hypothetical protein
MIRSLRNQQQSPLHRLPTELRNNIYGHVLGGFIISFPTARPRHHCLIRFKSSRKIAEFKPSNLLLVCRQINAEAQLLPFELNEFNYRIPKAFKHMLDLLSDRQVNAIKVLHIDTSTFYQFMRWPSLYSNSSERFGKCRSLARLSGLWNVRCSARHLDSDAGLIQQRMLVGKEYLRQLGCRGGSKIEFESNQ